LEYKNKSNQFYVILSISIVLFFLGLFFLIILHSQNVVHILKEKAVHVIELEKSANSQQVKALTSYLEGQEMVISSSVEHVSKEAALKTLDLDSENSFFNSELNPFSDVVIYSIQGVYDNNLEIAEQVEKMDGVSRQYAQNIYYNQVKSNMFKLGWIVLIVAICFCILAIALVFSTMNLQLYADRFEIKTMELVGAEDSFIKKPYLQHGIKVGLLSGILSAILLVLAFFFLGFTSDFMASILQIKWLVLCVLALIILSVVILVGSNRILLSRYLSKQANDLYK